MRLSDAQMLFAIRLAHTVIYVVNGAACFVLLYAAITWQAGTWLWVALGLVAFEAVIMVTYRFRCPISPYAERYGAKPDGFIYDVFIPTVFSRYTFEFFSAVVLLAGAIAALRWVGVFG